MTLLCISESMPGRTCTIRDHHLDSCRLEECRGCLPRPAEVGILCYGCWAKFDAALAEVVGLVTHLRSITRGQQDDVPSRAGFGPVVLVPETWQAADNIRVALAQVAGVPARPFPSTATLTDVAADVRELVGSIHPEQVVSRAVGAEAAVRFFREVQRARHLDIREDRPRHVRWIRCRQCGLESLLMRPPLEYLDDLVVECTNLTCRAVWDPSLAAFDMRVLAQEVSAEFRERGEAIAKEVDRMLKPAPVDDAVPVCEAHGDGAVMVNGPKEDEMCVVCGEATRAGLYRVVAA